MPTMIPMCRSRRTEMEVETIKHSCRYCNNLTNGDAPYCWVTEKTMTEDEARQPMDCPKWLFNPMDALWEKDWEDDK